MSKMSKMSKITNIYDKVSESDCHAYIKPLEYDMITSIVYTDGYELKHVTNLSKKRIHFKTDEIYIRFVIHYIKKILMKLPDLRKVKIYIKTFDKNNIIHQLIVSVCDFIGSIYQIKINKDAIFIYVQYENEIKFIGTI